MKFKLIDRKQEYMFNDYGIKNLKNKIRIVRQGDTKLTQWFDENGLCFKCKYTNGTVETYERDDKGRVTKIFSNDKLISVMEYDDELRTGREYTYDIETGEVDTLDVRVFDYNHPDRIIVFHSEYYGLDSVRTVEWTYDDKGRLISLIEDCDDDVSIETYRYKDDSDQNYMISYRNPREDLNLSYFLNYDENGIVTSLSTIYGTTIEVPKEKVEEKDYSQLLQAYNDNDELIFEFVVFRKNKVAKTKNIKLANDLNYTLELNDEGLPIKFTLEDTLVETYEYISIK